MICNMFGVAINIDFVTMLKTFLKQKNGSLRNLADSNYFAASKVTYYTLENITGRYSNMYRWLGKRIIIYFQLALEFH